MSKEALAQLIEDEEEEGLYRPSYGPPTSQFYYVESSIGTVWLAKHEPNQLMRAYWGKFFFYSRITPNIYICMCVFVFVFVCAI